jgi:hypothetical protein
MASRLRRAVPTRAVCIIQVLVITTAPTFRQVKVIVGEIAEARRNSRIAFPEPTATELKLGDKRYAVGLSTNDPNKFQSYHAAHVLIIADEGQGILNAIWEARGGHSGRRRRARPDAGQPDRHGRPLSGRLRKEPRDMEDLHNLGIRHAESAGPHHRTVVGDVGRRVIRGSCAISGDAPVGEGTVPAVGTQPSGCIGRAYWASFPDNRRCRSTR